MPEGKDLTSIYGTISLGGTKAKSADHVNPSRAMIPGGAVGLTLVIIPPIVFVIFANVLAWSYMFHALYINIVCTLTAMMLLGIAYNATGNNGAYKILSFLCFVGMLLGYTLGWYIHETKTMFWYGYRYGAHYSNVVPTQLAAQFADAGTIAFENEAYVDTPKSVGYIPLEAEGQEFCVAPISGPDFTGPVQYWAVGRNCCKRRSAMWCDDIGGEKGARTGVVIFDNDSIFPSRNDYYQEAINLAEATWEVESSDHALLVRFVTPDKVQTIQDELKYEAILYLVFGSFFCIGILVTGGVLGARTCFVE